AAPGTAPSCAPCTPLVWPARSAGNDPAWPPAQRRPGRRRHEPGPAHPGRDRRAYHRCAAEGVLRGHGHRRPRRWPGHPRAVAPGHRGPGPGMEVSVLEAKRLHHRAVLRLSWLLLVASVALSTLLQVAVAPPTLVGYLTAGATPVWLLGSFAVLSLLYRTEVSANP